MNFDGTFRLSLFEIKRTISPFVVLSFCVNFRAWKRIMTRTADTMVTVEGGAKYPAYFAGYFKLVHRSADEYAMLYPYSAIAEETDGENGCYGGFRKCTEQTNITRSRYETRFSKRVRSIFHFATLSECHPSMRRVSFLSFFYSPVYLKPRAEYSDSFQGIRRALFRRDPF